jgi:hypothetical protein
MVVVVLNTLTQHNFQDAFKKMAESLEMVHVCCTLCEVMQKTLRHQK